MKLSPFAVFLLALAAATGTARADLFNISATFPGGVTGAGTFQTDGVCNPCNSNTPGELTNFTYTIDDDTFVQRANAGILFNRTDRVFSNTGFSGADAPGDIFILLSDRSAYFSDEDTPFLIGSYTVTPAVAGVPEPGSMGLLLTAAVLALKCKRRKRT